MGHYKEYHRLRRDTVYSGINVQIVRRNMLRLSSS